MSDTLINIKYMRKLVLFCASSLLMTLFISCSNREIIPCEIPEQLEQDSFQEVLLEIDKLNESFGCINSKSEIHQFSRMAADAAGEFWFGKFAGYVGTGVGAMYGGPIGAYGLGTAGYILGSMAGNAVASWVVDVVWNWAGWGYSVAPGDTPSTDNTNCALLDDYSCGAIHNEILLRIQNNGKNYIDDNGTILVSELYKDALQYEKEICYPNGGGLVDQEFVNEVESYCIEIRDKMINLYKSNKGEELPFDEYFENIADILSKRGALQKDINKFHSLYNELSPCAQLDDSSFSEYEKSFSSIVLSSSLAIEDKSMVVKAGSTLINSAKFWY